MIRAGRVLAMAAGLAAWGGAAQAGVLSNGIWEPTKCGSRPVAPSVNSSSPEATAQSMKFAQLFADKIKEYERCFIAELNADMAALKSAGDSENARTQSEFDTLNAAGKAANARQRKEPGGTFSPSPSSSYHNDVPQQRPTTSPYSKQDSSQ
jgi:hypothetical protein